MIKQFSNKEIKRIIGENARSYRKELGMSQQSLADKCGLSVSIIQRFEKGTANINLSNLLMIMRMLGQIENASSLFPEHPINPYKKKNHGVVN